MAHARVTTRPYSSPARHDQRNRTQLAIATCRGSGSAGSSATSLRCGPSHNRSLKEGRCAVTWTFGARPIFCTRSAALRPSANLSAKGAGPQSAMSVGSWRPGSVCSSREDRSSHCRDGGLVAWHLGSRTSPRPCSAWIDSGRGPLHGANRGWACHLVKSIERGPCRRCPGDLCRREPGRRIGVGAAAGLAALPAGAERRPLHGPRYSCAVPAPAADPGHFATPASTGCESSHVVVKLVVGGRTLSELRD